MKNKVENVRSSSTDPTLALLLSLPTSKIMGMNASKCEKPPMFSKTVSKD